MAERTFKGDRITVTIDSDLLAIAKSTAGADVESEVVLRQFAKDLAASARSEWPVESGLSKSGIVWDAFARNNTTVEAFVSNTVPYAQHVILGTQEFAFEFLVIRPGLNKIPGVGSELRQAMLDLIEGG